MLNSNGQLINSDELQISSQNRGFKYGDAIFETLNVQNGKVVFWEDHYFRLMASMRMLRMEIPMEFTLEFLEKEILKTIDFGGNQQQYRARLSVFRKDGGLYTPKTNEIDYLIEASECSYSVKSSYRIDLFKDFYNYSGLLSTVKTTNRMVNTLASIFMDENELDNCILLNEKKGVVEAANANIFIVKGSVIKTPAITEGCIKGVMRKNIIEILEKNPDFTIEETSISPFEMQKADEVFLTNSIIGIQPVTNYRKREFKTEVGNKLAANLKIAKLLAKV